MKHLKNFGVTTCIRKKDRKLKYIYILYTRRMFLRSVIDRNIHSKETPSLSILWIVLGTPNYRCFKRIKYILVWEQHPFPHIVTPTWFRRAFSRIIILIYLLYPKRDKRLWPTALKLNMRITKSHTVNHILK